MIDSKKVDIKRGVKYGQLMLIIEDDANGLSWHEAYLCKFDDVRGDDEMERIYNSHPILKSKGVLAKKAGGGLCVKMGTTHVWHVMTPVRYSDAMTIAKLRVLPFMHIEA